MLSNFDNFKESTIPTLSSRDLQEDVFSLDETRKSVFQKNYLDLVSPRRFLLRQKSAFSQIFKSTYSVFSAIAGNII